MRGYLGGIANISLAKRVVWMPFCVSQRLQVASVAQYIDIQDVVLASLEQMPDKSGAYESGPTGHKDTHSFVVSAGVC
ncbi:hypothetical protein GCM10010096_22080 [Alcaligenes pakistanensis]|uniref:Uncharacterized protein n=1 Tax=Alcaligenes pakistanensis TaxID=1482717 RepID=A0A8H9M530_9BURK|nr:hypothetical protein GCM10010096_22080 [Alcaligenes pakistanensis]